MTALVHHDPALQRSDDIPNLQPIGATDAVVRVDTTTPCGTDMHLLKSEAPPVTDGRIFGYEVVGTVVEVGSDVHTVHVGDRLLVSCSSARGHDRSLLHRCRLVAEAAERSSHATSSIPGWIRLEDDSARPSTALSPPPALASSTAVRSAGS